MYVYTPSGFGLQSHWMQDPGFGGRNPYGQNFLHCTISLHTVRKKVKTRTTINSKNFKPSKMKHYNFSWQHKIVWRTDVPSGFGLQSHWTHDPGCGGRNP